MTDILLSCCHKYTFNQRVFETLSSNSFSNNILWLVLTSHIRKIRTKLNKIAYHSGLLLNQGIYLFTAITPTLNYLTLRMCNTEAQRSCSTTHLKLNLKMCKHYLQM